MRKIMVVVLLTIIITMLGIVPSFAQTGNDYITYSVNRDSALFTEIAPLIAAEFLQKDVADITNTDLSVVELDCFYKSYQLVSLDCETISDIYDQTETVESLISNDYNVRFLDKVSKGTYNFIYNDDTEQWEKDYFEYDILTLEKTSPDVDFTLEGMLDYALDEYPNLDFSSVKYIQLSPNIPMRLLYFVDSENEYITVYDLWKPDPESTSVVPEILDADDFVELIVQSAWFDDQESYEEILLTPSDPNVANSIQISNEDASLTYGGKTVTPDDTVSINTGLLVLILICSVLFVGAIAVITVIFVKRKKRQTENHH